MTRESPGDRSPRSERLGSAALRRGTEGGAEETTCLGFRGLGFKVRKQRKSDNVAARIKKKGKGQQISIIKSTLTAFTAIFSSVASAEV